MSHAFHDAREKYVQSRALRTEQWQDEVRKAWTAGAVTVMTHEPPPKRAKYRGTSKFLRRLAFEGGRIVCTNKLTPEQVIEARESQRLFVLADGVGFVIFPDGVASSDCVKGDRRYELCGCLNCRAERSAGMPSVVEAAADPQRNEGGQHG